VLDGIHPRRLGLGDGLGQMIEDACKQHFCRSTAHRTADCTRNGALVVARHLCGLFQCSKRISIDFGTPPEHQCGDVSPARRDIYYHSVPQIPSTERFVLIVACSQDPQ
jgi:hypothetical protein